MQSPECSGASPTICKSNRNANSTTNNDKRGISANDSIHIHKYCCSLLYADDLPFFVIHSPERLVNPKQLTKIIIAVHYVFATQN